MYLTMSRRFMQSHQSGDDPFKAQGHFVIFRHGGVALCAPQPDAVQLTHRGAACLPNEAPHTVLRRLLNGRRECNQTPAGAAQNVP